MKSSEFITEKQIGYFPPKEKKNMRGRDATALSLDETNEEIDIIQMDVALFIRCLEWAKESAGDDVSLHKFTEKAIAKDGVLTMADYDDLIPQDEMKEGMGGWNHKGANVTANTKVEPGFKTSDEKQKERFIADIQKRKQDAKQRSVKEDASAGASGSASIATGPAQNLLANPIKRTKSKANTAAGKDNLKQ